MKSTIFEHTKKRGLRSLLPRPRYLGIRIIGYENKRHQLRKGYVQYYLCTRNPRTPSKNPDCTISIILYIVHPILSYTRSRVWVGRRGIRLVLGTNLIASFQLVLRSSILYYFKWPDDGIVSREVVWGVHRQRHE